MSGCNKYSRLFESSKYIFFKNFGYIWLFYYSLGLVSELEFIWFWIKDSGSMYLWTTNVIQWLRLPTNNTKTDSLAPLFYKSIPIF